MKVIILAIAILFSNMGFSQRSFTVLFDFDKYALTAATLQQLDSFMNAEKTNLSRYSFSFKGHCDGKGSDAYNDKLAERRVAAVKKYFASQGIKGPDMADAMGYGKRQPLNDNSTDEDRRLNRRVEISYIEMFPAGMTRISDLKEKIADTATKAGTNIVLKNINFYGGMHQFLPESTPMLQELLDAMKAYPTLVIRIEGHICCEQTSSDGLDAETGELELSEQRAKAVMNWLVTNGIDAARISYKGFGHSQPLYPYPEKNEEEQKQNRRVEIKIIRK